jgi:hypothetical protein
VLRTQPSLANCDPIRSSLALYHVPCGFCRAVEALRGAVPSTRPLGFAALCGLARASWRHPDMVLRHGAPILWRRGPP